MKGIIGVLLVIIALLSVMSLALSLMVFFESKELDTRITFIEDLFKPPEPEVTDIGQTIGNIILTDQEMCSVDGKPSVYFYGTSTCPHCAFLKPYFKEAVEKFGDMLDVHAWYELDITPDVPEEDMVLMAKYNPQGYVPIIILGCKAYRIGTVHEQDQPKLEEQEIRAVLCKLTGNPQEICGDIQDLVNQIE